MKISEIIYSHISNSFLSMALRNSSAKMNAYYSNTLQATERIRKFTTLYHHQKPVIYYVVGSGSKFIGRKNELIEQSKEFPFPGNVKAQPTRQKLEVKVFPRNESCLKTLSIGDMLVAKNTVERAPNNQKMDERSSELKVIECPRLLKNDLKQLFPNLDLNNRNVSVLNISQKTTFDMGAWSVAMELERMQLTASFIDRAKNICNLLRDAGFWADFIDPSSGRPYLGQYTNATLLETDERYRDLGFIIKDLGCCRVLEHVCWGSKVFVGTIFTDASHQSEIIETIVSGQKMK